ncbi:MAG: hypothetical protein V7K40_03130 [Nostoc sp.]
MSRIKKSGSKRTRSHNALIVGDRTPWIHPEVSMQGVRSLVCHNFLPAKLVNM